jgi:hypothetical protein
LWEPESESVLMHLGFNTSVFGMNRGPTNVQRWL